MLRSRPASTLFPYTTLFRSSAETAERCHDLPPERSASAGPSSVTGVAGSTPLDLGAGPDDQVREQRQSGDEHPGDEDEHRVRSEEHTSELQSHSDLVCRLLL